MMTQADIDRIKSYCEKATPGPWTRVLRIGARDWTLGKIESHVAKPLDSNIPDDWDFIEFARTDLPACIAEIERLQAELKEVQADGARLDLLLAHCSDISLKGEPVILRCRADIDAATERVVR